MTLPKPQIREDARSLAAAIGPPAVRLRGVSKVYRLYDRPHTQLLDQSGLYKLMFWRAPPKFQEFHALRDIDLTIARGERVGIVGRNGAGKTTLLKLITRNFAPTGGHVEVHGTVQALMQLGIGFHPEFSGYENIRAALNYNGLTGKEFDDALEDVIDFVELGDFLHQPFKTYSLGMNARVQFAAATAIKPDIVIIDEILGAGDAYFAVKSAQRMESLAKSGCTILLVSHSWQQIQQYCNRVVWLREGRVFMDGIPHEILAAYEVYIAEETAKAQQPAPDKPEEVAQPHEPARPGGDPVISANDGDLSLANGAASAVAPSEDAAPATEGPDYATVHWIAKQIREHDHISAADEFQDRLDDGHRVFRVSGIPGLRFSHVSLRSNGARVNTIKTGDELEIRLKLIADRAGAFVCTYWLHFFGIDGRRLCRLESPPDQFRLSSGEERLVTIGLGPLLLGAADYLISFSVFDLSKTGSAADTLNTRFEMLARSYQLRVVQMNDSDPPLVHYPGIWKFGNSPIAQPSPIRGGV